MYDDSHLRLIVASDELPNDPGIRIELYETTDDDPDMKEYIYWTVRTYQKGGEQRKDRFWGHYFPARSYKTVTAAFAEAHKGFEAKCADSGVPLP